MRRSILCIMVVFALVVTLTPVAFATEVSPLKILLVGYGWYYGIPEGQVNNAELIALALDGETIRVYKGERVVAEGNVYSIVIPVTWSGAWPPVEAEIDAYQPDIVVGLGTSAGARGIRPEPYGSNVMSGCDALPPKDPSRECKYKEPIETGGPDWREGNLPYTKMVLGMLEGGIPAYRGKTTGYDDGLPTATPGWYLCNFLTYTLAKYVAEEDPDMLAGFIHIPTQPEYVAGDRYAGLDALGQGTRDYNTLIEKKPSASMKLSDMIDGIRISLEECLRAAAK